MTTPTADSGVRAAPDAGLRPGVLKVRHAAITSLTVITPAPAILFLPIPIAANAGAAMPRSIVVAFAVVLVIMNAIYRFSIPVTAPSASATESSGTATTTASALETSPPAAADEYDRRSPVKELPLRLTDLEG